MIQSWKLYTVSIVKSMSVVAGGTFVLSLPESLTTFTVSMIYLLMRSFTGLSLVRPFTSCAATGARFLVCLGRLDDGNVGSLWLAEVSLSCVSMC